MTHGRATPRCSDCRRDIRPATAGCPVDDPQREQRNTKKSWRGLLFFFRENARPSLSESFYVNVSPHFFGEELRPCPILNRIEGGMMGCSLAYPLPLPTAVVCEFSTAADAKQRVSVVDRAASRAACLMIIVLCPNHTDRHHARVAASSGSI